MRGDYLPVWIVQFTGLLLILFFAGFWAFTDRIEPTLIGVAFALIGAGEYHKARRDLTNGPPPPTPPPVAKESVEEGSGP